MGRKMVVVDVGSDEERTMLDEKSKLLGTAAEPDKKDRHAVGLTCVALSTVFYALMSTIIRAGSTHLSSPYLAFFRAVFQLSASACYAGVMGINPFGPPDSRRFLVMRGIFGFLGTTCVYYSLRFLPVGDATAIAFTGPVITIFMAAMFLGEQLDALVFVASACAFAGVMFVAGPAELFAPVESISGLRIRVLGVMFALGQAVFISASYVMIRKVGQKVHPVVVVFYFGLFVTLLMPFEGFLTGENVFMLPRSAWEAAILLSSTVLAVAGNVFMSIGLQLTESGRANAMRNLLVVFSFLCGWLVLGETPKIWSIIGSGIILSSSGIVAFDSLKKARRQKYQEGEDKTALKV